MLRHILPFFLMLLIFLSGILYLLNIPFIIVQLAPQFVASRFPGVELEALSIRGQTFKFPHTLILSDIRCDVKNKDEVVHLQMKKITLNNAVEFLKKLENANISVAGLDAQFEQGRLLDFHLGFVAVFQQKAFYGIKGIVRGFAANYHRFQMEQISAKIAGNAQKFVVLEITGQAYDGKANAQIDLTFQPQPSFIFWAEVVNLKPETLKPFNEKIFPYLIGDLKGSFRIVGSKNHIDLLTVKMEFMKGGAVHRPLVEVIKDFQTRQAVKDQLTALMAGRETLEVDQGILQVQKANDYRLTLYFRVGHEQKGMDLTGTKDISAQDGVMSLLLSQTQPQDEQDKKEENETAIP
jgi:hypothetical protein